MTTASEIQLLIRARDEASRQLQQVQGRLGQLGRTAAGVAVGLAGAAGLAGALGALKAAVIDTNSSLEQSKVAFSTMLRSGQAAEDFLQRLQRFAAQTPFEFPELVQASKRMLAFGFSAGQVVPLLTAVGDAVAAFGGGSAQIDRVTLALGQMQAKTRVSAEEMLQLTEAGIPAWQLLADAIGKSVPETQKLAEQGRITAGVFLEAFQRFAAANFGGMMERQARTFAGAMSTIKDSLTQAAATGFRPLFDRLSELAQRVAQFVQTPAFQAWVEGLARQVEFALQALGVLATGFRDAFDAIARIVLTVGAVILDAFALLNPLVRHSPSLVESVELGFGRIARVIGDLPGQVLPALRAAGGALQELAAVSAGGLARAAAGADAALLRQVALLGSDVVPAYLAARDRLREYQAAIDATSTALAEQERALAAARRHLEDQEAALRRVSERVSELTGALADAKRGFGKLARTPLAGENEQNQTVFGLRNAMTILARDRERLLQSTGISRRDADRLRALREEAADAGTSAERRKTILAEIAAIERRIGADNAARLRQLDEEIRRHEERLRLEELEQQARFDGERNYIDQVRQALDPETRREQTATAIVAALVAQRERYDELVTRLQAAKAEQEAQQAAVARARADVEAQQQAAETLREIYRQLTEQAGAWAEQLRQVEAAARDLASALGKAGGGGAGGLPRPPALPNLTQPDDSGPREGRLNAFAGQLADLKTRVTDLVQPLKDLADALQSAAGKGKDLGDAVAAIKQSWDGAAPVLTAAANFFSGELTRVTNAYIKIWTTELLPALARLKAWWESDSGQPVFQAIKTWLDTHLPTAVQIYRDAWIVGITGATGAFALLYQAWTSPQGQPVLAALKAWLDTELTAGIGTFLVKWSGIGPAVGTVSTILRLFLTDDGRKLLAWLQTDVAAAARKALDKLGELADFFTGAGPLAAAVRAAVGSAGPLGQLITTLATIKSAIEALLTLLGQLATRLRDLPSPPAAGGGGGGQRGVGAQQVNHISIDARGADPRATGAAVRAALADLATLNRRRLGVGVTV